MSLFVVIGESDQAAALRERLAGDPAVSVFADTDSLQALEIILSAHPRIVALSPGFAATGRGAGLVARLKGDADLSDIDVRVLLDDERKAPLVLTDTTASAEKALLETSRPLSRAGTRAAVRYVMDRRSIVINGARGALIDLSATGAQVLAPSRVRPSEPVRISLPDDSGDRRFSGTIVWSVAVPTGGTIQYRAGAKLTDPDAAWLESYCIRYGGQPDLTFGVE